MDLVQRAQVSASLDTVKALSEFAQQLANGGVLSPEEAKDQVDRTLVAIINEAMYLRGNVLGTHDYQGVNSEKDTVSSE